MKKNTRNLVALAVTAVLGAGPLAGTAFAGDSHATPAAAATGQAAETDATAAAAPEQNLPESAGADRALIRTVDEAAAAVREIHGARLALFDGMTDDAAKLVSDAAGKLDAAQKTLGENAMMSAEDEDGPAYLPFDTSFSLAEDFVPAEEHQQALQQAKGQLEQGDQKGAAESLRLADIELSVSAAMIPAEDSLQHVREAEKLIGESKFYEANLALKAVEDSVIVEVYGTQVLPTQGQPDADATSNAKG